MLTLLRRWLDRRDPPAVRLARRAMLRQPRPGVRMVITCEPAESIVSVRMVEGATTDFEFFHPGATERQVDDAIERLGQRLEIKHRRWLTGEGVPLVPFTLRAPASRPIDCGGEPC